MNNDLIEAIMQIDEDDRLERLSAPYLANLLSSRNLHIKDNKCFFDTVAKDMGDSNPTRLAYIMNKKWEESRIQKIIAVFMQEKNLGKLSIYLDNNLEEIKSNIDKWYESSLFKDRPDIFEMVLDKTNIMPRDAIPEIAVYNNKPQILRLLLEKDNSLDKDMLLYKSLRALNKELQIILLEKDAKVDELESRLSGDIHLDVSDKKEHYENLEWIISQQVNIKLQQKLENSLEEKPLNKKMKI